MVTIQYGGRLGNNMFSYVPGYIFAKKHSYRIGTEAAHGMDANSYNGLNKLVFYNNFGKYFNIDTSFGVNDYSAYEFPRVKIYNADVMALLDAPSVPPAHYIFEDWFQMPDFVLKYREEIRSAYNPQYRERDPQELFVSVRLGDILGRRAVLPLEYYFEAIERVTFTKGYISSDTMEHPWVDLLIKRYGLIPYVNNDPLVKLDFAKDFNQLVLSEGTYCWWMGALSKAKVIICNNRHEKYSWHGNIFVYPDWVTLNYDSAETVQ